MPLSRTRGAGTLLACATASVLLITGCSSDSGEDTSDNAAVAEPTPEPVRFAELPNACRTVDPETIEEVVPKASNDKGEELASNDVNATGTCLWTGLDGYDFRSLTVTLKRFDSNLTLGSGDARAEQFLQTQVDEITGDEDNEDVDDSQLPDLGDEAVTIAYAAEKESGDATRDFQQQRVVSRLANVVVTVDYAGTGFEGGDMPSADAIREAAERVAADSITSLDAAEDAEGGDGEGGADENGGEDGGEEAED